MPRLALFLFGTPRIEKDNTPIQLDTRKAVALLAYLASTAKSHSRDALATLLWPNYDQTHARSTLRRTLSVLNKTLGEGWLKIEREAISLNRTDRLWMDVDQFHTLLSRCPVRGHPLSQACAHCPTPLVEAAKLYKDDFLAGFSLRDSPNFDDWQSFQTHSLRRELARLLERLLHCHKAQGKVEEALSYAHRWLTLDPLHEATHRHLMELYARAGQRSSALRQYEECVRTLRGKLGASPHEETTQLYEAIKEGRMQTAEASPLKPQITHSNNLPRQLTSFIGRRQEMAEVKRLLTTTRLLTLTGSGGCGKTRLALEVASGLVEKYQDGPWLVELAALSDPSLVPQRVAAALDVREQPGRPLKATLSDYLRPKQLLMILDNCEHLIEACATLSESLLRACPGIKILATSREALGIAGETTYRVPSLSLPDPKRLKSKGTSDLTQYEAPRLFMDRAAAAIPTFEATNLNTPIVEQICRHLDGIPLAIELAAALVRALSVDQILARLDDRFRLLTGGSRTALPRHQTLRAAMDWSYSLLSDAELALFRRLSVFAGGFTLEAAEAVCADASGSSPSVSPHEVLNLLIRLINKSLVVVEEHGGEGRYRLIETIRQYGREKLIEAGEEAELNRRHRDWYLELAEAAEPELRGPDQRVWFNSLETEHDNLRAALRRSLENRETEEMLRLAGALWRFWYVRGYLSEGREWLERVLAEGGGTSPPARAKALAGAGILAWRQGDYGRAKMLFEESLALYRELGNNRGIAESLRGLGFVARDQRDYEGAVELFEESLALSRKVEDKWGIAWPLNDLGVVALSQGDYGRAVELCKESLFLFREIGDGWGMAVSLNILGIVAQRQGEHDRATLLCEESLGLFRELEDKKGIADSLRLLGFVAMDQGDFGRSAALIEESLALCRELVDKRSISSSLLLLGFAARVQGDYGRATTLLKESLSLFQESGAKQEAGDKSGIAHSLCLLGLVDRDQGDYGRATALLEESLSLFRELEDRRGIAQCLEGLAAAVGAQGGPECAARIFGAAEALREVIGVPMQFSDRADYDRSVASVRTALGEEAFSTAWAEGRKMTSEEAVEYALCPPADKWRRPSDEQEW